MNCKTLLLSILILSACKGDSNESASKSKEPAATSENAAATSETSKDTKPSECSSQVASLQSWVGQVGLDMGHDWSTQREEAALVATPKGGPLKDFGAVVSLSGSVTSVEGTPISEGPIKASQLEELLRAIDKLAGEANQELGIPVIEAKVDVPWSNIVTTINVLKELGATRIAFVFEAKYPKSTAEAAKNSSVHDAILEFGNAYVSKKGLDAKDVALFSTITKSTSSECEELRSHLDEAMTIAPAKRMSHSGQKLFRLIEGCDCAIDFDALKEFYWYFLLSRPVTPQNRFIVVSLAKSSDAIKVEGKAEARWEEVAPTLLKSIFNDIPKPIVVGLVK